MDAASLGRHHSFHRRVGATVSTGPRLSMYKNHGRPLQDATPLTFVLDGHSATRPLVHTPSTASIHLLCTGCGRGATPYPGRLASPTPRIFCQGRICKADQVIAHHDGCLRTRYYVHSHGTCRTVGLYQTPWFGSDFDGGGDPGSLVVMPLPYRVSIYGLQRLLFLSPWGKPRRCQPVKPSTAVFQKRLAGLWTGSADNMYCCQRAATTTIIGVAERALLCQPLVEQHRCLRTSHYTFLLKRVRMLAEARYPVSIHC